MYTYALHMPTLHLYRLEVETVCKELFLLNLPHAYQNIFCTYLFYLLAYLPLNTLMD